MKRGREDEASNEGRKVFVYNLPWEVQWQQLKDLFAQAGNGEGARGGRWAGPVMATPRPGAGRRGPPAPRDAQCG
jgi:hypothetical protein